MKLMPTPEKKAPCITLIGMPGAGKSTIGTLLAQKTDNAFIDTDHLIEATYGLPLQAITDAFGKEKFLDVEAEVVASLRACRAVIATGGSVVYREKAMRRLQELGTIVYIRLPFEEIERRVARNPQRGIAMGPNQTLLDIFNERAELYERYADLSIDMTDLSPGESAEAVFEAVKNSGFFGEE